MKNTDMKTVNTRSLLVVPPVHPRCQDTVIRQGFHLIRILLILSLRRRQLISFTFARWCEAARS